MRKAIQTDNAPKPIGPYSQGIIEGDFIFLAGQGPTNPATGKVEMGQNIRTSLAQQVAEELGNTPAVCRKCYIHPAVVEMFLDGHREIVIATVA